MTSTFGETHSMPYELDDTIAAIGTAAGGAVRGMVRVSGPQVLDCLSRCFRAEDPGLRLAEVNSSRVIAGELCLHDGDSALLPCDLLLWPGNQSYTRQPMAELHTLGSAPLLEQLLSTVCKSGARLADPGEFTMRAFLAGRLDLTEAEAVLGVIDAQSSGELQTALSQLAGGLSGPLSQLREQLLQILAELEAGLDFVEEDIEFISAEQLLQQLTAAQKTISQIVAQLSSRGSAKNLPRVVLAGPPNAGKSSLFNALVQRFGEADGVKPALVSDQTGTTRDFVTAVIALDGLECLLVDTAGVEDWQESKPLDQLAQQHTDEQREQANLIVWCEDATSEKAPQAQSSSAFQINVSTKIDLQAAPQSASDSQLNCSSVTGAGLTQLADQILTELSQTDSEAHSVLANTSNRCAESLRQAEFSLAEAVNLATISGGDELIAAELRTTLQSLGQVIGTVYTDDILDRIFGQFCIGK